MDSTATDCDAPLRLLTLFRPLFFPFSAGGRKDQLACKPITGTTAPRRRHLLIQRISTFKKKKIPVPVIRSSIRKMELISIWKCCLMIRLMKINQAELQTEASPHWLSY